MIKEERRYETEINLTRLRDIVFKHVGELDKKCTITNFFFYLYSKSQKKKGDKFANFTKEIKLNGGEEFEEEFLIECFNELEKVYREQVDKPNKEVCVEKQDELSKLNVKKNIFQDEEMVKIIEKLKKLILVKGTVFQIVNYGIFVNVNVLNHDIIGLCHNTQIPSEVKQNLKRGQNVYVKILKVSYFFLRSKQKQCLKIDFTMIDIDQETGFDRSIFSELNGQVKLDRFLCNFNKSEKKIDYMDKWEKGQLLASSAVFIKDGSQKKDFSESDTQSSSENMDEFEKDLNILINKTIPKFLNNIETHSFGNNFIAKFFNDAKNPSDGENEKNNLKYIDELSKNEFKDRSSSINLVGSDQLYQSNVEQKKHIYTKKTNYSYKNRTSEFQSNEKSKIIVNERKTLPIFSKKDEILSSIKKNQFLIVIGETGSGKTTQLVQYFLEDGFNYDSNGKFKIIGCTQPRRVAAISVSKRVCNEVGSNLGETVGYSVRFDDITSSKTAIKYMTDGVLQREALNDPYMNKYSVIILDEAHERSLATDVLFSLLKKATKVNKDLKVIIASATLDSMKFSKFFNNCPVINVPGRSFPVEIIYSEILETDYISTVLDKIILIHCTEPPGDILVFLTGQEEIDTVCDILNQKKKKKDSNLSHLIILPIYSSLPSNLQNKIFDVCPVGFRKVILATNIAETSITIDGICYVIDPGYVKINAYNTKLGMESLTICLISQAQANQRSGRAGRTQSGKCYRLYTKHTFDNEMDLFTIPEIKRKNLSHVILMLKAMGINDLLKFDFMDPPSSESMISALYDLYTLSALDDKGNLTLTGKKMVNFPMEPALAKTLITSVTFKCTEEVLIIVALLSVQNIFYRPKENLNLANRRKKMFHHPHGDHLTLLNVYKAWKKSKFSKKWCDDNFIHERNMKKAEETKLQISKLMAKFCNEIVSCNNDLEKVRMAFCAGFFKNFAFKTCNDGYKTIIENYPVYLHPSSSLFQKSAQYVFYHNVILTKKEYMQYVTIINKDWLVELAPSFYKFDEKNKSKSKKTVVFIDKKKRVYKDLLNKFDNKKQKQTNLIN